MPLKVYNTLSGKKELFETIEPGEVRMYVCGPTVYDSCHIGHARSVVFFDIVYRFLSAVGYDVTYIRNFTDVDDKIINRANQLGVSSEDISEKYINEFYRDMDALNVKRATIEPRATQHIGDIINIVSVLIEKNMAYPMDGDVYFRVASFEGYGKLSGRKLEDMEAGARIDIDERKENPFDFALWKTAKPGEPSWDSPWGKGRPGWHIECSAMSWQLLGESFDIHGGGKDLIFPHHENEIAQSEAAFGRQFVRYWLHNGFVNINSEKMSKSLGNTTLIKDILAVHHPETVRLFLLSNHYRSPIDFTDQSMKESAGNLDKLYGLLQRISDTYGNLPMVRLNSNNMSRYGEVWKEFFFSMEDDFNTARGLAVLFEAVRKVNRIMDDITDETAFETKYQVESIASDIVKIANIFGILTEIPYEYFDRKRSDALKSNTVDPETIETMIDQRTQARKNKDFATADRIRKELEDMKITIEDRADGTIWKVMD
ncbi:MAG: cysteine--tRNA ligase [Proteobacteria bacterium]|nr:cysteine--tRNA ligase [Pseudomonadota bacterium]